MQLEKKFHKQNLKCKYTHLSYNDYLYILLYTKLLAKIDDVISLSSMKLTERKLLPKACL